jgi:peptidoglycan L-alanyl-D-glutamate endopeptidase CwlK
MTETDMQRLEGVHPRLRAALTQIFAVMATLGHPMRVISGLRTDAEQAALYAQGRTSPGAIVTYRDGSTKRSEHQAHGDGLGHAVDCAFLDDPDTPTVETWDERKPWELYGVLGETLGLAWGGRWRRPIDKPHLELRND